MPSDRFRRTRSAALAVLSLLLFACDDSPEHPDAAGMTDADSAPDSGRGAAGSSAPSAQSSRFWHYRTGGGFSVPPVLDASTAPRDAGDGSTDADADAADARMDAMPPGPRPEIAIAKWYDNHTAAISLNLDGDPEASPGVVELVQEHHVALDCELVTGMLTDERIAYIESALLPAGITFFGHGQVHENHDRMTYEEALDSATQCFQTMQDLGLSPVSFAYPGGHGQETETQQAISDAGFLSARGHSVIPNPYIVPDDVLEPRKWFLLPDIVMESYDYQQASSRVNDTEELIPFLDGAIARTAWIIVTYHAIGRPDLFGFYYLSDFASDLDEITARDFWSAPMDAITLYVRERKSASASITRAFADDGQLQQIAIYLADDLPNDRYVQPLTLLFAIPPEWVDQPLAIVDDVRRWPDQVMSSDYAALSLPPFEREFRISLATTPYPGDPVDEADADAGQ